MEHENNTNQVTAEIKSVNRDKKESKTQADHGIYKKRYLSEKWRFFLSGIEFSLEEIIEPFLQSVEESLKDDPDQDFKNEFTLLKNLVYDRIDTARGDLLIKLIDDELEQMSKEERDNLAQAAAEDGEYNEEDMRPTWNSELFIEDARPNHPDILSTF